MKKFLLAVIIAGSLASCNKERECYHCTFGVLNGVQKPPVDYCGTDGGARQFTDEQGNKLTSNCRPK